MSNFEYHIAEPEHRNEIRRFIMKHFLVEETMNVATRITEDEFAPFADEVLNTSLRTPFSVICRNETSGIVGAALSTVCHRDDPPITNPLGTCHRPEIAAVAAIVEEVHGSIWKLLDPQVNTVLELDILSVALPYQRLGIAAKMLEKRKSPELLAEYHIQGFVCQASSFANQMLLKKRGHQELLEVPFTRYLDKDGEVLIRPRDETQSVKLFWKPYDRSL